MSEQNTGGPAFPSHGSMGEVAQEGMTLRDYFAAAMPTDLLIVRVKENREKLVGRPEPEEYPDGIDSMIFNMEIESAIRYLYADAMLRERSK